MSKKRVAVIGSGICGLLTLKSLREEGLEPTCFEKTGYIGGLWKYHDDDPDGIASVMKTTIINSSKEMSAVSNFPPPAEFPNYMHNSMMYEYIESIAEKFDILKYVKLNHETLKIEKAEDYKVTGRWKVTCKNKKTNEILSDIFDFVCVCIGHHVYPIIPEFPGQEDFSGKIMHTHSLKNAKGFDDMNVVVVGVGNSGMDAAVELSSVAKKVYLSTRRGTWIFPKIGMFGLPLDASLIRRTTFFALHHLPYSIVNFITENFLNVTFDHALYRLKPKHRVFSGHPTLNDSIPIKLLSGVVVVRGNIKKFTKNGVIFENEEEETPVDAVVLGTGYHVKFSFLSEDILPVKDNKVSLYKFIIPPEHPTLAILGQVQPNGPGIPVFEIQCRWVSRVMSGKITLPSKEEMYTAIKENDDFNKKRYYDTPRHTFEVDFVYYTDDLASEIGVKPNLLKLAATDPKLFCAVLFGPCLSYQYRLQGPHAWKGARNAILTYNERVKAPLGKAERKLEKRKNFISFGLLLKILFLIPMVWYFFLAILVVDF